MTNIPSFLVRASNQRNIDFMEKSTLISGKAGRIKKKKAKNPPKEAKEVKEAA
jgi:hypothetical protein